MRAGMYLHVMYVSACMSACTYYARAHVVPAFVCLSVCMDLWMYVHMYACMHVCVYACRCVRLYLYIKCMCVCARHIYIYSVYMHTCHDFSEVTSLSLFDVGVCGSNCLQIGVSVCCQVFNLFTCVLSFDKTIRGSI